MRTLKFFLLAFSLAALAAGAAAVIRAAQGPGRAALSPAEAAAAAARGHGKILDLGYALNDHLPAWPGDAHPFEATINARPEEKGYFTRRFCMLEHYGTHLDAPAHFPPGKATVDQIPAERLFGPAVVVDVRRAVAADDDYRVTRDDVLAWEKKHGRITPGAVVVARTGWTARWPDAARYRNQDKNGAMHFPGFSVEAAELIVKRGAAGLGIDTLSVDYGASLDFPVHRLALGAGLYHLENLADLSALPESGAFLVVAPIKLEGGSGGPARVFALLP